MDVQRALLAASLALNVGLGVGLCVLVLRKPAGAPAGLAARLQPLESQGKSVPSAYEQNEVRNTLTKHATAPVQVCFRDVTAKDPSIKGGIVQVDWQILPSGMTKSPEIISSSLPAMNECIVRVLSGLEFPPPPTDRPVYVSHKFNFQSETKPGR